MPVYVWRPCLFFETSSPSYQSSAPHLSHSFSNLSIFNFHCHFYIHRFCRSISPSRPSLPPTSPQGCQSFRDPVSCEIAQIAVALRLARQQRGERQRKKKRERFYASTLLNLNRPSPSLPLPPLIHSDMDKHTHSCKTATHYNPNTSPSTHTHTQHLHPPPSPPALSMWPRTTLMVKTPRPLCFSVRVTSQNNLTRACSTREG